jgi:hypothetical protein
MDYTALTASRHGPEAPLPRGITNPVLVYFCGPDCYPQWLTQAGKQSD